MFSRIFSKVNAPDRIFNLLLLPTFAIPSRVTSWGCGMRVEQEYAVFGRVLKKYRIKKKYSQEVLADLVELTRASIANIETGKQRVMLRDALALANVLEFSLDEVKSQIIANKLHAKLAEQPTRVKSMIEKVLTDIKASP